MANWIRDDQAAIHVSVEGTKFGDSWKQVSGGNLQAASNKARPGAMGREQEAGGEATRTELTVEIPFSDEVAGWIPTLEDYAGWGSTTVGLDFLDRDRSPNGIKRNRTGVLLQVNPPDMGADDNVGNLSIVVGMDELRAA